MKVSIALIILGSMWLGAGLLSLYLDATVASRLAEHGLSWSFDTLSNSLMAGIPIGIILLFIGIQRMRRLIK
jgi:hypothetical protein